MSLKRTIGGMAAASLLALALAAIPQASRASSHREAPLISNDPAADSTDLYAFVSPDRTDTVTIIANYVPLIEPNGGPNFASFGDDVLYELHVDNSGDARPDVTYQFRFQTHVRNGGTWLYNTGPIESLDDPDWNTRQTYTVTRVQGGRRTVLGSGLPVPPPNIGPRSTPGYHGLAAQAVRDLPGGIKVFAGPRDDPFFVDLGSVFDLGGLRPFNEAHLLKIGAEKGVDGVSRYNTMAIAIQVPIAQLTRTGAMPKGADDPTAVLGIYTSASRQTTRVIRGRSVVGSGPFVQVSRLGNPLVNEVVIPLAEKDYWNMQPPWRDSQFAKYYTDPSLAAIVNLVYPPLPDAPTTGRADLVAVLLTGVPTLNYTGAVQADMLRLNVAVPVTPPDKVSRLAVLEGDFGGFPNGRRLADDVTDIELRAVAGGYGPLLEQALKLPNLSPNNAVGDGVDANEVPFLASFPYLASPWSGYESVLHR
ncbi:MAG TPA: DUF4331 domain-containing protein [Roseiflexaceae bacterium]|nr:DUF4331 domain-containing protein [Roseiflexaceae bacterium]